MRNEPPFDPDHREHDPRCTSGLHASRSDDGQPQEQELQAGTAASSRCERAVVSAVMRAILPKQAARRAFLK